ncbi:Protein SDA1 [Kappamyces sp. JEL0829]|nr:Protein SDA1 [Kappamyces sp. JEL0829]
MKIFNLKPDSESASFADQIMFIAAVAPCYPKHCKDYPGHVMDLLSTHYQIMSPDLRRTMVQALMLMRNRNLISQESLLSLFFTLFRCKDKTLRQLLHSHIVSDIKSANAKAKNNKLNKTLQNYMYKMLQDPSEIAAKKSLEVMIELYHKNVWNDAKTVNVVAEACLSGVPKLVAPALHFFLGTNDDKYNEDDDDEALPDINALKHANGINKKRKSRANQLEKAFAKVKKRDRQKNRAEVFNFSALHLLNDPQGFADQLFSRLRVATQKNTFNFELRLEIMNLISRLIGVHKLLVLGFYDFLISYLKPHQKNVTQILAYLAQASHELVPPDSLEAVIRAVADNFVWSNFASEVVTAGLNGLREICVRAPLAMPEELLKSLMDDYKNHRDKGPMQAARALLGLYREFNPELLKRKDRGKAAVVNAKNHKVLKYGEVNTLTDVADAELLDLDSDEDVPELVSDDEAAAEETEEQPESLEDLSEEWSDVEGTDGDEEDDEEDDGEDDEEDEEATDDKAAQDDKSEPKKPKPSLATQKIFTDEDFAKIRERRERREAEQLTGIKSKATLDSDERPDVVDADKIMAFTRKKDDYEARLASIKEGREGREKFGSKRGKDERSSITNREKSKRNKPMTMLVHKRSVKGKKNRSLVEKQRIMRKHINHVKKKGH